MMRNTTEVIEVRWAELADLLEPADLRKAKDNSKGYWTHPNGESIWQGWDRGEIEVGDGAAVLEFRSTHMRDASGFPYEVRADGLFLRM